MTWLLPSRRDVAPLIRATNPAAVDRHRPGYWRDYHQRNLATRRPYLTAKAREYRARR